MAISSHRFPGSDAYAATVNRLPGGPPLAYWRIASTSSFLDAMGVRHGSWTNTGGSLVTGLPQGSDGAVDFKGVATAEVAHDTSLALSALTLSFWFKANSFPPETQVYPLIGKGITGVNNGDLDVMIEDDGAVRVQMQTASETLQLFSAPIDVGTAHHVAVRADGTGFDAYLDGQYLGKNTGHTGAWSANTQAITFASAPWATNLANAVLDEVALYARTLTEADVLELAQRTTAPVAATDSFLVPENASTVIDITANDTFVGAKSALTVEIMSPPGGGDSVAVKGNNDVEYTAGAVTGDTARSFTYRITDPNGTSNTATVNVTVQDSAAPPASNANCFVQSGADTVEVSSMAALESAVNAAPPGRNILIAPGTYPGGTLSFTGRGTEANPIVIRPRDGIGTVTITGPKWILEDTSAWLMVSSLHMTGALNVLKGDHNRITRCRFRNMSAQALRLEKSRDLRIDHCDFSDIPAGSHNSCIEIRPGEFAAGNQARILIDYCYFHDWNPTNENGNPENIIRSSSTAQTYDLAKGTSLTVDHCLFENITCPNTGEFVILKWGGIIYRFCTFLNTGSEYLQSRSGGHMEWRSNWFENVGTTKAWSEDLLVIGNRFVGNEDLWVPCGNGSWADQLAGTVPSNRYEPSTNSRFIGNRFGSGHLLLGQYWPNNTNPPASLSPDNLLLEENVRDSGGDAHIIVNSFVNPGATNVTINPTASEGYTPAVKLTAADVGLNAPDPLCG